MFSYSKTIAKGFLSKEVKYGLCICTLIIKKYFFYLATFLKYRLNMIDKHNKNAYNFIYYVYEYTYIMSLLE